MTAFFAWLTSFPWHHVHRNLPYVTFYNMRDGIANGLDGDVRGYVYPRLVGRLQMRLSAELSRWP
jgi:hypothetical protein